MKKITSLLMLFLAFVGTAWAQLPDGVKASTEENPIRYNMGSMGNTKGYYATINPNGGADQPIGSAKTFTADKAKAAFIFVAVDANDATKGYKIKVEIGNKFYEVGLSADNTNGAEVKSQTTPNLSTWKFIKKNNNGNKWALNYLAADNTTWKDGSWNMFQGAGNNLKTYGGDDQGSKWFCIEEGYPGFVEDLDNSKVYLIQSGRSSNTQNEYLLYNAAAPDHLSSTWGSGQKDYDRSKVAQDANAQWVLFKGKKGTYFYNLGAKKFVGTGANFNGNTPIPMNQSITHSSQVYDNGQVAGYHFVLATNGWTINVANIANCHGVVSWGNYNEHLDDGGNCVKIIPTTVTINATDLKAIEDKVAQYEEKELLANLLQVQESIQGYVGGLSAADVATLKTKTTYAEASAFVNQATKIELVAGKYYRLKNLLYKDNYANADMTGKTNLQTAISSVVLFEANTNSQYTLKMQGAGLGHVTTSTQIKLADEANWGSYKVIAKGDGKFVLRDMTSSEKTCNCIHEAGGTNLVGWEENAQASQWYIVPATQVEVSLTQVGTEYYSTAFLPFAVSEVAGATAYTGQQNGQVLHMTSVASIPAQTGVVLKGAADKATLTIGDATATVATGNALSGTLLGKDWAAGELVLGNHAQSGLGFYSMTAGAKIGANKAFIPAAQAAQGLVLSFDGEATGIESVMGTANTNAPIFDLSGRRVVKTVKGGLYIQNGKKFIVR